MYDNFTKGEAKEMPPKKWRRRENESERNAYKSEVQGRYHKASTASS
jgi:hypothetical protein